MVASNRFLVAQDERRSKASASRYTRDGRFLTYELEIFQQPRHARACGAGAKSSADRRPVDPPPIIGLKIFQGEGEAKTDITLCMEANYFLFAYLEYENPTLQDHLPADQNRPPVLTGTPVAGMVYLDRPTPAGFFIFPDLSVRHEGQYRLSFSLFEETKHACDGDRDDHLPHGGPSAVAQPDSAGIYFTHRLEIKSADFTVYSAKKFPGLAQSTELSRVVAEQGCRVRIRRDIRMRRSDKHHGSSQKEWDGYEDSTAAARDRMSSSIGPGEGMSFSVLPAPAGGFEPSRPRSTSSQQSVDRLLRRNSLHDPNNSSSSNNGTFPGSAWPGAPSTPSKSGQLPPSMFQSPSQQYPVQDYPNQTTQMPPPGPYGYYQQGPPAPQPLATGPPSFNGYSSGPSLPYGAAPPPASPFEQHHQQQHDNRRPSMQAPTLPPPAQSSNYSSQPAYSQQPYQSQQQQPSYQPSLAPLAQQPSSYNASNLLDHHHAPPMPTEPPVRTESNRTPLDPRPRLPPIDLSTTRSSPAPATYNTGSSMAPEPGAPSSSSLYGAAPPASSLDSSILASPHHNPNNSKRTWTGAFSEQSSYTSGPLRNGARPSESAPSYDQRQPSHSQYSHQPSNSTSNRGPEGYGLGLAIPSPSTHPSSAILPPPAAGSAKDEKEDAGSNGSRVNYTRSNGNSLDRPVHHRGYPGEFPGEQQQQQQHEPERYEQGPGQGKGEMLGYAPRQAYEHQQHHQQHGQQQGQQMHQGQYDYRRGSYDPHQQHQHQHPQHQYPHQHQQHSHLGRV